MFSGWLIRFYFCRGLRDSQLINLLYFKLISNKEGSHVDCSIFFFLIVNVYTPIHFLWFKITTTFINNRYLVFFGVTEHQTADPIWDPNFLQLFWTKLKWQIQCDLFFFIDQFPSKLLVREFWWHRLQIYYYKLRICNCESSEFGFDSRIFLSINDHRPLCL